MEFKAFLRSRREELGLTQQDLADALANAGQETSYARVSHWETGRNKPPLEDTRFRQALATALELDVNEMMSILGFVVSNDDRSPNARLAADLIDQLPADAQEMVIEIIQTFHRKYA